MVISGRSSMTWERCHSHHILREMQSVAILKTIRQYTPPKTVLLPPLQLDSISRRTFFRNFTIRELLWLTCYSISDSRSEEHTSELQSRPHLVCRLLLEKKNGWRAHRRAAPRTLRRGRARDRV